MSVFFYDKQKYSANPSHGTRIDEPSQISDLLRAQTRDRPPFFAELVSGNGMKLLMGIGENQACAQWSSTAGDPPYWMALGEMGPGVEMTFLIDNTTTEVPGRFGISVAELVRIAAYFVENGTRDPGVRWEEI